MDVTRRRELYHMDVTLEAWAPALCIPVCLRVAYSLSRASCLGLLQRLEELQRFLALRLNPAMTSARQ
eukprot:765767-Hanusia_phi.AAC.5